ncbi:unnamed protein product [Echinostoma caproni]|uniref:ORF3 n=1 Tax=Echinostoma caproni TaxID=27848 RepID=A0A183AHH8_9TREM|nr:unnamed protein product [Echinostoma caproni]
MYPYPSYKRRRAYLMNSSYERRRARIKQRSELEGSTEDDVSDWSESVMKNGLKPKGPTFTSQLSCESASPPS